MTSLVNPQNINGNFPIAGQDNDSQVFRDNFTNIRNNFTHLKSEIEDIQNKAVFKDALTGSSSLNNDFDESELKNPQLRSYSETTYDWGSTSGSIQLDFALGNVHKLYTSGAISINSEILNWSGAAQYSRMRFYLTVSDITHTMQISSSIVTDLSSIPGLRSVNNGYYITFPETGTYVFEFSSVDSGTTVYIKDISRGNPVFRDPNFYFSNIGLGSESSDHPTGFEKPTLKMGWGNIIAISDSINDVKSGKDVLSINGSITSHVTVTEGNIDASLLKSAGFSVVTSRVESIDAGETPVQNANAQCQSGDLVGYFNALGLVNRGNVSYTDYQQLASIQMYANGTSTSAGIGGNIVIATKKDGVSDNLYPAVVIDNTQGMTVLGNLRVLGTSTTIESDNLILKDRNIILAQGSANVNLADFSGIQIDTGSGTYANLIFTGTDTSGISGGVFGFNKGVNVDVATSSVDSKSGALIVLGGVGVGGDVYVGQTLNVTGTTTLNANLTISSTSPQPINAVGASGVALLSNTAIPQYTTSNSLIDLNNLNFTAEADKTYKFESIIFHDIDGAATKGWAVTFGAGTCNYVVEQNITATGALSIESKSTTASPVVSSATAGAVTGMFTRITGTYYHTVSTNVKLQANVSAGANLAIYGSSFLKWTKLN